MAGLLDFYNDPRQQAILGLAGGLLSASGPSSRPVGFGSALGQGLLTSAQMFNNATQVQEAKQLKELQAETMRQQLAQRAFQQQVAQQLMGGSLPGGAPAAPVGLSNASAAWLGAPWAAASNIPQASPAPATGAPTQGFPLNPAQIAALKMAGLPDLTPMFNASRPNVEVKDGVMYDKNTGNVISTIPTMNQQGFATQLVPDGKGGYTVQVVQGATDAYRTQQSITQGEQAKYNFHRDVPLPDANGVLRPTTISAFNLAQALPQPAVPGVPSPMGGAPAAPVAPAAPSPAPSPAPTPAPAPGARTAPAIQSLQEEFVTQRAIAMDPNASQMDREVAANRTREAGAELRRLGVQISDPVVYPSAPGPAASGRKPGQGETEEEKLKRDQAAKRAELEAQSAKQRMDDLVKAADGQKGILSTLDTLEAVLNRPDGVKGTGLADRAAMVAHQFGYQTPASTNTARVRELGAALVNARGSLGAGVSNKDAEIYEKAAGNFQNAKSVKDMLDSIAVMREIAQKSFSTTNEQITRFRDSGQLAEYREPIPRVPSNVGPSSPQNPGVQRDRAAILKQYGLGR